MGGEKGAVGRGKELDSLFEPLNSSALKDFLIETFDKIPLLHSDKTSQDRLFQAINLSIYKAASPRRLREKLADLLDVDDERIPLDTCLTILYEKLKASIIHPEIRALFNRAQTIKKGLNFETLGEAINQAILTKNVGELSQTLSTCGINAEKYVIEKAVSKAIDRPFEIEDNFIKLQLLTCKEILLGKKEKLHTSRLDDPLYDALVNTLVNEDAAKGIKTYLVSNDKKRFALIRDTRQISKSNTQKSSANFYYTKWGIHLTIALRSKLAIENLLSQESHAVETLLSQLLNTFLDRMRSHQEKEEIETVSRACFLQFVQYQLVQVLMKYNMSSSINEAVGILVSHKAWITHALPALSVATLYRLSDEASCIVYESPIVPKSHLYQEEWLNAHENTTKPLWYRRLTESERALYNYYYPNLMNGSQFPNKVDYPLPGIKYGFKQHIVLVESNQMKEIGHSTHFGTASYLLRESDRDSTHEMERLSCLIGDVQVEALEKESEKNITVLLNSAKGEERLGGVNELKQLSLDERIHANYQHAAEKNEKLLLSNITVNGYQLIEKNDYSGVEEIIDTVRKQIDFVYQYNLSFISDVAREALFRIGGLLEFFKRIESERRGGDYRVNYKIALGSNIDINGIEILGHLEQLILNLKILRRSFKKAGKEALYQAVPAYQFWYGSASGLNATAVTNFHLITNAIRCRAPYLSTLDVTFEKIPNLIADSEHCQQISACFPITLDKRTRQRVFIEGLPALYKETLKDRLLTSFEPLTDLKQALKRSRQTGLLYEKLDKDIEKNIASSLLAHPEKIKQIIDLDILKYIAMLKPSLFTSLSRHVRKPLHHLLLYLSNVEKDALYLHVLKTLYEPNALGTIQKIKDDALLFLSQLLNIKEGRLTENNYEPKFDAELLDPSERETLEKNLLDLLTSRELLLYNQDKASVLIENYLNRHVENSHVNFFVVLADKFKEKGFCLSVFNETLANAYKQNNHFLNTKSRNAIELIEALYQILPGGRLLNEDEKKALIAVSREEPILPFIKEEEACRQDAVKKIIHIALTAPQEKLGAVLLRFVRSKVLTPISVLQRDKVHKILSAESIYHAYLISKLKRYALLNPYKIRWGIQGYIIFDISLFDEDYEYIVHLMTGETSSVDTPYEALTNLLHDRYITRKTICVIDVVSHPILENLFRAWLLSTKEERDFEIDNLRNAVEILIASPYRGSIIPLVDEMETHLRFLVNLIKTVYDENIGELKEYSETTWERVFEQAALILNEEIKTFFQSMLVSSTDKGEIDVKSLNKALDKARASFIDKTNEYLISSLIAFDEKEGLHHFVMAWEIISLNIPSYKPSSFAAIKEDYFRVDIRSELSVRISATQLEKQKQFSSVKQPIRRLIRRNHYQAMSGTTLVTPLKKQQIIARIPALTLNIQKDCDNEWHMIKGQKAINLIADKLEDTYQDISRLMGGYKGPVVYHLLNALKGGSPSRIRLFKKEENEEIATLIQGAHQYNCFQVKRNKIESLFYLQTIPVNLKTEKLSLYSYDVTIAEISLMSEIALLHTLRGSLFVLPQHIQNDIDEVATQAHRLYINYLKGLDDNTDILFRQSAQGKALLQHLIKLKDKAKPITLPEVGESTLFQLSVNALFRLYIDNYLEQKEFGMLIQALSMFLGDAVIVGAESGDAYYQAVMGRAELLQSIQNKKSFLSTEEKAVVDAFYALGRGEENAAFGVKRVLDIAYNNHNLYGASLCFLEEDYNPYYYLKPDEAGESADSFVVKRIAESPDVKWLIQDNVIDLVQDKGEVVQRLLSAKNKVETQSHTTSQGLRYHYDTPQQRCIFKAHNEFLRVLIPYIVRDIFLMSFITLAHETEATKTLKTLKETFATFYGLKNEEVSFVHWHRFLNKVRNVNTFELIFIPLLRNFCARQSKTKEEKRTCIELDENGAFQALSEECLFEHLLKPLGYTVHIYNTYDEGKIINRFEAHETSYIISLFQSEKGYEPIDSGGLGFMTADPVKVDVIEDLIEKILKAQTKLEIESVQSELKAYVKDSFQDVRQTLQTHYNRLVDSDALLISEQSAAKHITEAMHAKPERLKEKREKLKEEDIKSRVEPEISSVLSSTEKAKKAIQSLLGYSPFPKLELMASVESLNDVTLLKKHQKFASKVVLVLSPLKVLAFYESIAILIPFLKERINHLNESTDTLTMAFSPYSKLGKLFENKEQILNELERRITLNAEYMKGTLSLIRVYEGFIKSIDKHNRFLEKDNVNPISISIHPLHEIEEKYFGSKKTSPITLSMTSKAFESLDTVKKGDVLLKQWQGQAGQMLAFTENHRHDTLKLCLIEKIALNNKSKMELALVMLKQLVVNMKHYPSRRNKIVIEGDDLEMAEYLWAASYIIGTALDYNRSMIDVKTQGFKTPSSLLTKPKPVKDILTHIDKGLIDKIVEIISLLSPVKKRALSSKSAKAILSKLLKSKKK